MDKNPLFRNHIFNVNKKASYNVFIIHKIHRYLTMNTAQEIGLNWLCQTWITAMGCIMVLKPHCYNCYK